MSNKLAAYQPKTLKELVEVGNIFAASEYFKDARAGAQAIVKIMAGQEMGLGLFESMNGFHIIEGKMTMAANLIAALVKRADGYDYKVLALDRTECRLEFVRNGESLGVSEFTIKDAEQAGLIKPRGAWEKWPTNMLFARAVSNGVRFFCPEVTAGPVYTPDELGAEVDESGALDWEAPTIVEPVQYEPDEEPSHWIDDAETRRKFWAFARFTLGLSEDDVYQALSVESVHAFKGDKRAALELLKAFAARDDGDANNAEVSDAEDLDEWFGDDGIREKMREADWLAAQDE